LDKSLEVYLTNHSRHREQGGKRKEREQRKERGIGEDVLINSEEPM
jgi:hypothetical protein